MVKLHLNVPKNSLKAPHMFISSAFFQKYELFVDKLATVLMAEIVAPTPDQIFVEIRYKSLYMETYMVKQIISPPIKLSTIVEIFICQQRNNKILTWYGRRNDTFCANRLLIGPIPPLESHQYIASAHIIIQDFGYVDIQSIKFHVKICQFLQEHLKSFCDLENGVQITKTSSSLWLVIITYIYTSLYDEIPHNGSEIHSK